MTGLEGTAYKWVTASDLYGAGTPDRVFSKEHLFTLNVYNLKKIVNDEMIDFVYQPNALTNVIKWSRVAYDIFNAYSYDYDTGEYVPGYIGFDDYRFEHAFQRDLKAEHSGRQHPGQILHGVQTLPDGQRIDGGRRFPAICCR